jgi:general stress protein YciG
LYFKATSFKEKEDMPFDCILQKVLNNTLIYMCEEKIMTQQKQSGKSQKDSTAKRGFASMNEEKQREIASKGGHAAHEKGTAHEFTPEEAREAGHKGGQAAHEKGTAHEFTPEEARKAGHKGGKK